VTAFTFSIEQLCAAPPEVRRWVAGEIAHALGAVAAQRAAPANGEQHRPEPMTLAACTAPDAMRVFEMIGGDAVVARLFFELGRETTLDTNLPEIKALQIGDLLHHTGLGGRDGLIAGLAAIDRVFRRVHGDEAGSLFGFDEAGHVYLHATTQASIRRVWTELLQARTAAEREMAVEPTPRVEGFDPPNVGPSVEVASHAAPPRPGGDLAL